VSAYRIAAIVLLAGGVLGLAYGSFTYVSGRHNLDLGVAEVSVTDHETVDVPVWAGVGAIVAGAAMLLARRGA
jgi:hypothetical protein